MLIPTSKNTKTVTDLREDTLNLLNDVNKLGHLYIFHRSNPKAVVLSIDEFERITEALEDYLDTLDAIQLEKEPRGKGIKLETFIKKHKSDA